MSERKAPEPMKPEELQRAIRRLALDERTSLQALGVEALAALLAARGG